MPKTKTDSTETVTVELPAAFDLYYPGGKVSLIVDTEKLFATVEQARLNLSGMMSPWFKDTTFGEQGMPQAERTDRGETAIDQRYAGASMGTHNRYQTLLRNKLRDILVASSLGNTPAKRASIRKLSISGMAVLVSEERGDDVWTELESSTIAEIKAQQDRAKSL